MLRQFPHELIQYHLEQQRTMVPRLADFLLKIPADAFSRLAIRLGLRQPVGFPECSAAAPPTSETAPTRRLADEADSAISQSVLHGGSGQPLAAPRCSRPPGRLNPGLAILNRILSPVHLFVDALSVRCVPI
jgi:hypothetical protein